MLDPTTGIDFRKAGEYEDRTIPIFAVEAIQNNFRSEQEGRPVYDDVEMVRIIIPGDRRTEVYERVNSGHRERYWVQYQAFKDNVEAPVSGTPIEEWPPLSPAAAKNLRYLNIRTVEALASVSDTVLGEIGMGARELREKAQQWLASVSDVRPALAAAKADNDALREQLQQMQAQMAQIQQQVNTDPAPKRTYNRKAAGG